MSDGIDPEELWPDKYQPRWAALHDATNERAFVGAAFELLKEAGTLATLAAAVIPLKPLARNEAILCGHLVRMAKLSLLLVAQTAEERGENHLSIVRQVFDSATALIYLLEDVGDGSRFDAYVLDSLVAEREFLKNVHANADERGETWPIEERIQESITRAAKAAGVDIKELLKENRGRRSYGWPSAEKRLGLLGPTAYPAYRMGSNAIHGTWTNLLSDHLEEKDGVFKPWFDPIPPRPQPLLAVGLLLCHTVGSYSTHIGREAEFTQQLDDLLTRLNRVDGLHEAYLQKRRERR